MRHLNSLVKRQWLLFYSGELKQLHLSGSALAITTQHRYCAHSLLPPLGTNRYLVMCTPVQAKERGPMSVQVLEMPGIADG